MLDVRKLLAQRPLLFDGGMGTYYKAKPGQECEQANLTDPEGILAVHRAYLAAGADAIKTNTFSLPRLAAAQQPGWEQLADAGWQLAAKAAGETGAAVFADLGPAPDTENLPAEQVYLAVAKRFALLGARNFLFETLSAEGGVLEAIRALKQTVPEAFVLVSFAVLPDGYTREGRYCAELVCRMAQSGVVDAVGLNCVSAPGAMRTLVQQLLPGFVGAAVLDADGLNATAQLLAEGKPFPHPAGELVVTPHPGEMARLTGLSAAALATDREGIALRYAKAWNAVVVLKGARTVVASPDGRVCVACPGRQRGCTGWDACGAAGLRSARLPSCCLCGISARCRRRPRRRKARRVRDAAA